MQKSKRVRPKRVRLGSLVRFMDEGVGREGFVVRCQGKQVTVAFLEKRKVDLTDTPFASGVLFLDGQVLYEVALSILNVRINECILLWLWPSS